MSKIKILIIEDNIAFVRKIKSFLDTEKSIHFDIVNCKYYRTALEKLKEDDFDVILYSINSTSDDIKIIEELLYLTGTPIIALSDVILTDIERREIKNNTLDILPKLFINEYLLIRTILLAKEYKKFILYKKRDTSKIEITSKKKNNTMIVSIIGLFTSILEVMLAYMSSNKINLEIMLSGFLVITFILMIFILLKISGESCNE